MDETATILLDQQADRAVNQGVFEKGIEPTLVNTEYATRLWATATCLSGGNNVEFAQKDRFFGGSFYKWEAPKPTEIEELVAATTKKMEAARQEIIGLDEPDKSIAGMRLAGAAYVLTTLIQPLDDQNKQTARLVSQSYLHETCQNSRDYYFPHPKQIVDERNDPVTKFSEFMEPGLLVRNLPIEDSFKEVMTEMGIPTEEVELIRKYFDNYVFTEERALPYGTDDEICRILGGDENDTTGVAQSIGSEIINTAFRSIMSKQAKMFLSEVVDMNSEKFVKLVVEGVVDTPGEKLMNALITEYTKLLPEILEEKTVHQ